ncbi:MAG: hypothetical protein V7641_4320 [Blastocatellia bacterium]
MNCQGCGHNYPNTLTRCPRCKMLSSRRSQRSGDSRLIEFPRKARLAEQPETSDAALPQWRQDLNEKVRAIQARRNNPALASAAATVTSEENTAAGSHHEGRHKSRAISETAAAVLRERNARIDAFSQDSLDEQAPAKNANPIVEKALSRVRRASENAKREYLPKIEPAKPARPAYSVENEATARALEPAAEIPQRELPAAPPLPASIPRMVEGKAKPALDTSAIRTTSSVKPIAVEPSRTTQPLEPVAAPPARTIVPRQVVEPLEMAGANDLDLDDLSGALTIDEIEPLDYLEAEIRKVDRALTAELHRDDRPSRISHLFMGVVDLGVIALSALPFLALIGLYNGDFGLPQTRYASLAIALMIAFFYLALTQSLCGRTFGMMLTNTRIIDAFTGEPVSAPRAILRTVGCFIAAAPAGIGLLWAAFSPQRRGWQDYLAGTRIISEF